MRKLADKGIERMIEGLKSFTTHVKKKNRDPTTKFIIPKPEIF